MAYDFSPVKEKMDEIKDRLKKELLSISTGRANPAVLDNVFIEVYGTKTAINHVAAVTTEDARTLRVSPWEKDNMMSIEQSINEANLGVSVVADDSGLRVSFPELTGETREMFAKMVKDKLEDARIAVRAERESAGGAINDQEKAGDISGDEKFTYKKELQDIVDASNIALEDIADKKEADIMS